jgi:hypothetical protein
LHRHSTQPPSSAAAVLYWKQTDYIITGTLWMKEGKIILYQNYFMHRTEIWVQTKRELKYTNTLQNFFRLDPKKNVE